MKILIFGLTISSSWGNGHATLWRGLTSALARRGWRIVFFERDVPYYAETRDCDGIDGELVLYESWAEAQPRARREAREADVVIVTSYCPDAIEAAELATNESQLSIFYDLDTPVTLASLECGETPFYIGPRGLADFDLVLSYTGGAALGELSSQLGARRAAPLYGHVDPAVHAPAEPRAAFAGDLSYLGTYAADRQETLQALFIEAARRRPHARFIIGGALYPKEFPWTENVYFVRHLPPCDHPAFFSSSRLTLNVTRRAMAQMGWCPSGRLFEAAACGVPIVSDIWPGIEDFFEPGSEILLARDCEDVLAALDRSPEELARIAARARARVLAQHTSDHRAAELEALLAATARREPAEAS
ncbi:MAG TPA: glycosyltransferase [Methylovirgula sp.]|nr:glycosyltransferase [Methylovirgula sp.]